MLNIKNRLIIFKLLFICLVLQQPFYASAAPLMPQSGIISDVSEKLILSIEDSQVAFELPYLYIPTNLLDNAKAELKKSMLGQEFIFSLVDGQVNRHGAFNAVVKGKGSNKSVQEALLEEGLALVYFVDSPPDAKPLFSAEGAARKNRVGIWQDDGFTIHDSSSITTGYEQYLNHFIIIEGVVDNIYRSKKNTYLNFGKDWKTDFTIQFDNKTLKKFPGFIPDQLVGKRLRARGWLENYNGPFMKIFNPANVEILDAK